MASCKTVLSLGGCVREIRQFVVQSMCQRLKQNKALCPFSRWIGQEGTLGTSLAFCYSQVASYMRAVLRTLSQCHHHKILHRDIKPGEQSELSTTSVSGPFAHESTCFLFALAELHAHWHPSSFTTPNDYGCTLTYPCLTPLKLFCVVTSFNKWWLILPQATLCCCTTRRMPPCLL